MPTSGSQLGCGKGAVRWSLGATPSRSAANALPAQEKPKEEEEEAEKEEKAEEKQKKSVKIDAIFYPSSPCGHSPAMSNPSCCLN